MSNAKVLAYGDASMRDVRAGLRDAGLDTRRMQSNPVDLQQYRDMGIAVPEQPEY